MNEPVDPRQAALAKRETRARRIGRIRGGVATLGAALVLTFSTVVLGRGAEGNSDSQASTTTADSAQSTSASLPESTSVGSAGSDTSTTAGSATADSSTLVSQSATLTTSQS